MPSPKPKFYAYGLLALLLALNILNFIDRFLIPALGPQLIDDLGLTNAQIGALYGIIFTALYSVMGLILGNIADRTHRPRLIAIGVALWCALTAASGMARSFAHLAAARVFVGIGEATLTPAAMSMLSDVFPAKRRSLASGVYYAGVPLGVGLGFQLSAWLEPLHGWRFCFYVLGGMGLAFVPILVLMQDPRGNKADAGKSAEPERRPSMVEILVVLWRTLRASPALLYTVLGGMLYNYAAMSSSLVLTWLVQERGMDYTRAANFSGRIYMFAGIAGVVAGGWIADWCHARWSGGKLWFLTVKALVALPFVLGFYTLPVDTLPFYACWLMSSLTSTVWFGPTFAAVQDLAPARIRSTIVAFLLLMINLFGGIGPLVTGWIGDVYSLWIGLAISATTGLLASIAWGFAAKRFAADQQRALAIAA